jgi:hypothetical protein
VEQPTIPRARTRELSERFARRPYCFLLCDEKTLAVPMAISENFESTFRYAYRRENEALMTQHIRHVRMSGDNNNNNMERMNGEIRDREKVVRGIKREDSPIIAGLQIYHNYVRSHMGLDGKTPADLAGIDVRGKDKWLTLIQNASRQKTKN